MVEGGTTTLLEELEQCSLKAPIGNLQPLPGPSYCLQSQVNSSSDADLPDTLGEEI